MGKTINLNHKFTTFLYPKPPFNFDGTVYVPHHFPTLDSEWRDGVCWQTMNFARMILGTKIENKGTTEKPKIRVSIWSARKLTGKEATEIVDELCWRYGLNEDISDFCSGFKFDKFLKMPLKKWRGMRMNCANSLYELLMISIALQNATVRRSVQMLQNLLTNYGTKLRFDKKNLFAYWLPKDLMNIDEDDLRLLKVGYRAKMIKRISDGFKKGDVNEFKVKLLGLKP